MKYILLTFDIEEFDLPLELGRDIDEDLQFNITRDGTKKVLEMLKNYSINGTFFISAKFAKRFPELVREIARDHEIGLHCYEHKDDYKAMNENESFDRLKKAKAFIEEIIRGKIKGFRAPRFKPPRYEILKKIKISYDSSYHPTYIPGRYNNLFNKRKIFIKEGVKVVPVSVSPLLRLPLFWIAFRNLPLLYSKVVTKSCLLNQDYVNLIFHSWEFIDINRLDMPFFISRNTGTNIESKLTKYLKWCLDKEFKFTTISDYLSKNL